MKECSCETTSHMFKLYICTLDHRYAIQVAEMVEIRQRKRISARFGHIFSVMRQGQERGQLA